MPSAGYSGYKHFNVEVSLSYRRVIEVIATCEEEAVEKGIAHLDEMVPELGQGAQIVAEVQK